MRAPTLAALALSLALAACDQKAEAPPAEIAGDTALVDPGPDITEVAPAAAPDPLAVPAPPMSNESALSVSCDNGETIGLRFFPDQGIAVMARGGQNYELNQERSGSGIRYAGGDVLLTGKGTDYRIEIAPDSVLQCSAVM